MKPTGMTRAQFEARFPKASADTIAQNAAMFGWDTRPGGIATDSANDATIVKKRIRQSSGPKMNKTEARFFEHLKATMPDWFHTAQSVTFLLANGVRFTPDFLSYNALTGALVVHETKGFLRDDAAVKIKVAASVYPWIVWKLVTAKPLKDGGGWNIEKILS